MEKYESKQVRINRPAEEIYNVVSDFNNFTPIVQDKVEGWSATADTCSFKAQGFTLSLRMVEKEPFRMVKVTGDEGSPMPFTFWVQLKEMASDDTRMRLVLHAEIPMMLRMMIGGKLRGAMDSMAEKIAESFNNKQK